MSHPSTYDMLWRCSCGWEGRDDDMDHQLEYHQTMYEPAEYSAWCPQCGGSAEDMEEVEEEDIED